MARKSKSKTPTEVQDNTVVVEEEKPSSSAKKAASEIDEIFAAKKRKKPETKKSKKPKADASEGTNKLKRKKKGRGIKDGGFGELPSELKKTTQEGLVIYTEEELGINKADAGNTRLCPFDCSCCF